LFVDGIDGKPFPGRSVMITESSSSGLLSGKRIVTVEDEGITQMQLRKLLTRAGLVVVGQARNGQEGVEIVLREKPDIVLMDITMPVMNGLDATRFILKQMTTCIMILTAYTPEDCQEEASASGAHGLITKPVSGDTLIATLEDIYVSKCPHSGLDVEAGIQRQNEPHPDTEQ